MKKLNKLMPLFILALVVIPITLAAADNGILDPDDPNTYSTGSLLFTGNYTISSNTMVAKGLSKSAMLGDNFLGINSVGDYVYGFEISINSMTDDLEEIDIAEDVDLIGVQGAECPNEYILADDMIFLVENLTRIESGESYFYGPDSAYTVASYPFLWIPNLYTAATGTNTTVTVKSGATSTVLLNDWITIGSEFWYDLSEDTAFTTCDNVTIAGSIIDDGVFIFALGAIQDFKDTRNTNIYVGGTTYSNAASGKIDVDGLLMFNKVGNRPFAPIFEINSLNSIISQGVDSILALPSTVKPTGQIGPNRHRITGWGSRTDLEDALLAAIDAIEALIDDPDDIIDYAVTTCKSICSIPEKVQSVAKSFAVEVAGATTNLRDYANRLADKTFTASKVIVDDPDDKPTEMTFWEWFKTNNRNVFDITKAALAGIVHGKTTVEWGIDLAVAVSDAQGRIDNAPTILNSISEAMYKSIVWAAKNWYWIVIGGAISGVIVTLLVLAIRKR